MVKLRTNERPGISVVVPVFNSQEMLPGLVERLGAVLSSLSWDYEVLLVSDGSRDGSWDTICSLASARDWIHGIQLMRNFGQHNALLCGIRAAVYSVIVTLDDDGQNPPEEIPKLVRKLREGHADLVYGVPEDQQHSLWRNLASKVTKLAMQSVLGAENARHISAFKAFHTRLRRAFSHYEGDSTSIDVLLGWGVSQVTSVRVHHDPRRSGRSNYTLPRLIAHTLNMITSFGVLPLKLASIVGFFFALFGLGVLLYVLARYLLEGSSLPGFPFLASIIAIFSGAQLFALGMMGEYLARIYSRSMRKPAYVIAQEVGAAAGPPCRAGKNLPSAKRVPELETS
jgi:undecaprenyl-phosphate 4-deoxy-4-formamido-L-arabinose transferase